jgi:AraC family transcriptional regulator
MYRVSTENRTNLKSIPNGTNILDYSLISNLKANFKFRAFSIKYAVDGIEHYTVNGNEYRVDSGKYILGNKLSEGSILISSQKPVEGICIDIQQDFLSEVVASKCGPGTLNPDLDLDRFFNTSDYLDNMYLASETHVGQVLKQIQNYLSPNPFQELTFSNDFFYNICENIVQDHIPLYSKLQNIPTVKFETKKELFRRVNSGKKYLDDFFKLPLQIGDLAKMCFMSEYHFFRVFKLAFGISPYHYLLMKRMNESKNLIKKGSKSISEIATECGYSDLHSFSKAFKKYYGVSPTGLSKVDG